MLAINMRAYASFLLASRVVISGQLVLCFVQLLVQLTIGIRHLNPQ